jgi:hypothetical protein
VVVSDMIGNMEHRYSEGAATTITHTWRCKSESTPEFENEPKLLSRMALDDELLRRRSAALFTLPRLLDDEGKSRMAVYSFG